MKFSLSLPVLRDESSRDPFAQTFELAQEAEQAGFDTATIGHHHFMPGNASDPLTFMAAVAARTSALRVGTGIFQLPVHNPIRVAEQVATIDQLSAGRISLGVGLGWWATEYEVQGSVFKERGARMEEALTILRLVWENENTSFDGRFWSFPELTVHPRPVQRPHPLLWVAGVADVAVDRAARLGDAWLCGPVQSITKAQSCLEVYRDARTKAGRDDADWVLRRYAWLGSDGKQVREEVLPAYVGGLMEHWRESVEDEAEKELFARIDAGENVSAEEIAADRLLWGDPNDVIGQVERYRETTGAEHVHAAFGAGLPAHTGPSTFGGFEELRDMIRLFGREVISAFPKTEILEESTMRAEFHELAEKINNWGRWGADDERGTLNFVTPEVVKAAAGVVRSGRTFSLAIPLSADGPQIGMIPGRINPLKTMLMINDPMTGNIDEFCTSDDTVVMGLQAGTHWDSLAHATYSNRIYNGAPIESLNTKGAGKCGIDKVGALVSRGVLLDVARAKGVDRLEPGYQLTAADLDAAAELGKVTVRSGDIVLVRTGQIQHLHAGDKMSYTYPSPGFSMQTALWLHEHEVAAVANDTIVFECFPGEFEDLQLPVHLLHLVEMGLWQGQNWDSEALAADCAEDGQYDFLLTATPEPFVAGLGAPVAPVAVK